MELTAVELKAILRAGCSVKSPSTTFLESPVEPKPIPWPSDFSDKENVCGSWTPGKGAGPIISNEEFEALPKYSDVDDDLSDVS